MPQRFRRYQEKRLKKHLNKVVPQSSFYSRFINYNGVINHREFPIMDKAVMMRAFDELNTKQISLKQAKEVALHAEENRDFAPKIGSVSVTFFWNNRQSRGLFS
ncbi:hypothetical protein GQR36_03860 [Enterococcus termitis]